MNPSKFDDIVKRRANERVQQKIINFKQEVMFAICKLEGVHPSECSAFPWETPNEFLQVIMQPRGSEKFHKWPAKLWDREEALVAGELMATMDEMSKALLAPEPKTRRS